VLVFFVLSELVSIPVVSGFGSRAGLSNLFACLPSLLGVFVLSELVSVPVLSAPLSGLILSVALLLSYLLLSVFFIFKFLN